MRQSSAALSRPPAAPAAAIAHPSREQALALARTGRNWEFLAHADRLLAENPQDHEVRLTMAARATLVGLATIARRAIDDLPVVLQADPAVESLAKAIAGLPPDRVEFGVLRENLRQNLEALPLDALAARDPNLPTLLQKAASEWESRAKNCEFFRASSGAILRRPAPPATSVAEFPLVDHRAAAESQALPFLSPEGAMNPGAPSKGIVIEGFDQPWLLQRVHRAASALPDGYAPRILLIEGDLSAFIDALALHALPAVFADPRVHCFIGPSAAAQLDTYLRSTIDYALPESYLLTPSPRDHPIQRTAEALLAAELLRRIHADQQAAHVELESKARAIYAPRNRTWWGARFTAAASGAAKPLRILLPISRYSTFVRHSATDMAEALANLGHNTRVLMEPDDHTRLSTLAYLRQFADWQPDLVVLINYTRRDMGSAIPANVPFVCCVQDRMPHLFQDAHGKSQGVLDFLLGHLHAELFAHFAYPKSPDRCRFRFVPASSRTFHDGPVDAALARQYECDIAYISHQSETPEAAFERLLPAFSPNPALAAAARHIHHELVERMRSPESFDPMSFLRADSIAAALRASGITNPDPRLIGAISANFAVPLAERMWRHATLEWAARIAERRGWRLAICGRGWDKHPTLARFARPEVPHDEALRTLYRSARACIHASLTTNAHQRVFECALSGGLMLRRGPTPDREVSAHAVRHYLLRQQPTSKSPDDVWNFEIPQGGPLDPRAIYRNAGIDPDGKTVWRKSLAPATRESIREVWPVIDILDLPDYAFPRSWETLFQSEVELESQLDRAINDAHWRNQTAAEHRTISMQRHTYDALAADILDLTTRSLTGVADEASQ